MRISRVFLFQTDKHNLQNEQRGNIRHAHKHYVKPRKKTVEKREDHRPMLADLRESGSIEQDADAVMFIYNPDMYKAPDAVKPGIVELNIEKNRSGERASIKLKFLKELTTFVNMNNDADAKSLESSMPDFKKKLSKEDLQGVEAPEKIVPIDQIDDVDDVFK